MLVDAEAKMVKIATNGLDYNIRKKLVNQLFLDVHQLLENVRQIEQIKLEKQNIKKCFRRKKVTYVDYIESE